MEGKTGYFTCHMAIVTRRTSRFIRIVRNWLRHSARSAFPPLICPFFVARATPDIGNRWRSLLVPVTSVLAYELPMLWRTQQRDRRMSVERGKPGDRRNRWYKCSVTSGTGRMPFRAQIISRNVILLIFQLRSPASDYVGSACTYFVQLRGHTLRPLAGKLIKRILSHTQ